MKTLVALLLFPASCLCLATENALTHVYRPLESLGGGIRVTRVPRINGLAIPESDISSVAMPFRALQTSVGAPVNDSNLASLYGIKLSSEDLKEDYRYRVDLDVRGMKQPERFSYTRQEVVEATLMCLRLMFPAGGTYKVTLRIVCAPEERAVWEPYEKAFFPAPAPE
jgi:hypothetical protein